VKISWGYGAGGGQTGTRVKWGRERSDDNVIDQIDLPLPQKKFEITGLAPGTRYYIHVYGINTEEASSPMWVEAATSLATSPPAGPTNLNAVPTRDSMALTWSGPANVTCYKISYGVAPSGPATDTTSPDPSFTVVGLLSNTNYYFDVRSSNSNGDSAPARIVKQTLQVPAPPTDLRATPGITVMGLTWSPSPGAIEYVIHYRVEPGGAPQTLVTSHSNHELTGLSKNTSYFIEVNAANTNGDSLPATLTEKTLDGPPIPSHPGVLHLIVTFDRVAVSWAGTPKEPGYELTYGLEDKYPEVIDTLTTEHLTAGIKYLVPDARYFIEVRAFNASGHSEPSRTSTTIGPDRTQPRNLRTPGRTFCEAWLKWDRPEDHSYLIDYEITCPGREPVRTTALEFLATGLAPEKEYLFKVQPRRPEGPVPALPASISVVTHDRVPPTCPQGLKLNALTGASAMLSWSASDDNVGVTGYEIRRNGGAWFPVSEADPISHSVSDLTSGVVELFEVRAKDAAGNHSIAAPLRVSGSPS
jgi:chitodextrinase